MKSNAMRLAVLCCTLFGFSAEAQTILTLGSGFNGPTGVAVDVQGYVYVADRGNNAVKMTGSLFAPGGVSTSTTALGGNVFSQPFAVAVDHTASIAGANVYIADTGNDRIMLNAAGSTGAASVEASGLSAPVGIVVGAEDQFFAVDAFGLVSFTANGQVTRMNVNISPPTGIARDQNGNLYVADAVNNAVKEIVASEFGIPASPVILTLAAGFNRPTGVAVDDFGNVYVADQGNNAVKEIQAVNGKIPASPTILTLGTGFSGPSGVAVDDFGDVFVADTGNNAVKEIVSPRVRIVASGFAGSGGTGISAMAVDDSGDVFLADTADQTVKEIVAADGGIPASPTIRTVASTGLATFGAQESIAVDHSGNVFVGSKSSGTMQKISPGGTVTSLSHVPGANAGQMTVDGANDLFVSLAPTSGLVEDFTAASLYASSIQAGFSGSIPLSIAADLNGHLFIAYPAQILELSGSNFGTQTALPATPGLMALDGSSNLYDLVNNQITEYFAASGYTTREMVASSFAKLGFAIGRNGAMFANTADAVIALDPPQAANPIDTVTVTIAGSGSGQVTSSPAGIACSILLSSCSAGFPDQTTLFLFASATVGSSFTGWSGPGAAANGCTTSDACMIPLSGNLDSSITATFDGTPASILSVTTMGSGQVFSAPSGISCGQTCNAAFADGTAVSLSAVPGAGFSFVGWSGAGCSGTERCAVAIDANTTVNAKFVQDSTSDVALVASVLPASRSVTIGATATAFATVINPSPDTTAAFCQIQSSPRNTDVAGDFFFQTTDPHNNQVTGARNATVDIPPGGLQTFVFGFTPSATILTSDLQLDFTCSNALAAPIQTGLDTFHLSASATATLDVIAIAATISDDGIVDIPGATGVGAFAVATTNVGADGVMRVSASGGLSNLPAVVTVCQTVTATGQCMAPPVPLIITTIAANDTPSFAFFVQGLGPVPFQPATNRIVVQFGDEFGNVRGSTSVAVRTQ